MTVADERVNGNRGSRQNYDCKNLGDEMSRRGLHQPDYARSEFRRESGFGNEVTFCPLLRFRPFAKSPIIDELIERIDAARQR